MTPGTALDRGRAAFGRKAWGAAYDALAAADARADLEPADLECLGTAAFLLGRDEASTAAFARAHQAYLDAGNPARAARCAFWIAFGQLENRDHAQASGWLARAGRLLDDAALDCVERGYLLVPQAVHRAVAGDFAAAMETFQRAAEIGERFGDPDLVTLARHGHGRALINLGHERDGITLLDEVMVAVTAGDTSPVIAGLVYCSVLSACHECFDVGRAREWTAALTQWCAAQPDLVPYRGQCLIHRAEVLQLEGAWPDALEEARRARELLTRPTEQTAAGAAWYRSAELHRLRGEFDEAERAYREAGRLSGRPQPGLALLRLAQGEPAKAEAAIERMAGERHDRHARPWVLAACVEIMIAARRLPDARRAAEELAHLAESSGAAVLQALAAGARGAVLLADGGAQRALPMLREAWSAWEALDAPYEAARIRVLIGSACRALGDGDAAALEIAVARRVFAELRAVPDVARVDALSVAGDRASATPLTRRETEVLRLVAKGMTNRAIATVLGISERTVARHVSNIFIKLDVSSRSAATAYAYDHHLR
ncbi:MAG TPA: LuxR C-terminal-related transcriptional regulator [Gemmatimonadales bacterium]|nr:LuxR C-terminal-related transcriptional regulator [Gemmatimonadales bacterium]